MDSNLPNDVQQIAQPASDQSFAERYASNLNQNDTPEERVENKLKTWIQSQKDYPREGQIMRKRDELMVEERLVVDRLSINAGFKALLETQKAPSDQEVAAKNLDS